METGAVENGERTPGYPLPPYQFLLVQKIFEASRQFGAT